MIRSPIKLLCFNILFLLLTTTFSLTDDFYQSDDHRAFISYHEPLLHMEEDSWGMIGASDSGESKEDTIVLSDQPIRLNESMKGYVEVEIETINSSLKLPRWQQQNAAIYNCSLDGDSKCYCLGGGVDDLNDVLSLLAIRSDPNFNSRNGKLVKIHFSLSTSNDEIREKEYDIFISVEAINDPSFITVNAGTIQVPEGNTAVAIQGIKISDADCVDESDYLEVTLESQQGQLKIKGDEVVRFWIQGDRNRNFRKLAFRSNLSEINGLLKESLYYVPEENKVGDDQITVTVEDLTSKKTQRVEATLPVFIYPDCSLPSLRVLSMITLNEDSATTLNASISPSSCEFDIDLNISTSSGKISHVSSDEIEVTDIYNGVSGSGSNKAWNLALQKIVYTSDSNHYTIGRDLVVIKFEIGMKNQKEEYESARRETLVQIKSVPDPHTLSLVSSSNKFLETNEDQHLQLSLEINDPDILDTTHEGFIYKVSITSERKAQFVLGSYHGVIFPNDNDQGEFMVDYNSLVDCLKNITYIPSKDFHGHDIIKISATDSDGDFEDTIEIPVNVIPVFDEPSINVPQKFECNSAKVCELDSISFDDPDDNGSFKLRMNTNHGRLSSFHRRSSDWYDSVGSAFELNETLSSLVYFRSPDISSKHYDTISIYILNEDDSLVTSASTLVFMEEMTVDESSFIRYKKLSYHGDDACLSSFRSTNERDVICHDSDEGVPSLYCLQHKTCEFNYFEIDTVDKTDTDFEFRLSVSDGSLHCETIGVIELERSDTSMILRGKAFNLNSVLSTLTYISHSGYNDILSLSLLRSENFVLSELKVPIKVTEVDDNLFLKSSRELFFTDEDTPLQMNGIKVEYDGKFIVKALVESFNSEFKLVDRISNEDWSSSLVLCEYPRNLNKLLGSLTFMPDRDWNSEETGDYAELKISVRKVATCSDNKGLQDFESVLELPIHVLPINDYPLIEFQSEIQRDEGIVVPEDIALTIPMRVSDMDDDILMVSIKSPNGTIALYTGHGNHIYTYFTEGNGDGFFYKEIVLKGRKEAINEYLGNLQFRGDESYHGKTALTVVVQDSQGGYDSKETMITIQQVVDPLKIWSIVDSTLKQPIPSFHPGDRRIIARDWVVTLNLYSEMNVSDQEKELRPLTVPRPFSVARERLESFHRICTQLLTTHGGLSIPKQILENIEMKSEQRKEVSFVGDLEEINAVFANIIYDVTLQDVELIELKEIWDTLQITVATEICENMMCKCSFDKISVNPSHHQFKILIKKESMRTPITRKDHD